MPTPVIAIFDIGKTNKKLLLFDKSYRIVFEQSDHFTETVDEDLDACEDVAKLTSWVLNTFAKIRADKNFDIIAVNFATYGASFVYVDAQGKTAAPLYNYLKPYPEELKKKFYDTYGGETVFAFRTASPVLGSLNSGMQLYRIKYQKPDLFRQIKHALHLPQYVSFLFTNKAVSDMTSIGSHTNLWDFQKNNYHEWVKQEGVDQKLPPIVPSDSASSVSIENKPLVVGVGLHDSSAALIPYLVNFNEPFVLISTGTWCISLNPFNDQPLTADELNSDCLCYLQYKGKPVKASRLFAGHIHDHQVERIASYFNLKPDFYKTIEYNRQLAGALKTQPSGVQAKDVKASVFETRDLSSFAGPAEAYHQLMYDLIAQQYASTQLVLAGTSVKRIFVDGGFGKNPLYMNLLASCFQGIEIYAASMAQATALGSALAIHEAWNDQTLPRDLIELKYFSPAWEPQL
jgi:sugar (pentulose or hexulose) kinase